MSETQVETAVSRTAVAAFASLAPLYALLALKLKLRLDNLHVVLAQLLVLSVLRFAVNLTPKRIANVATKAESKITSSSTGKDEPKKTKRVKRKKAKEGGDNPKYNFAAMDAVLYRFLSIVDPAQLDKLGNVKLGDKKAPEKVALTDWNETFRDEGLVVMKHPNLQGMWAICYRFKDIEFRKLWEILANLEKRPTWDGLCEKTEDLEALGAAKAAREGKSRQKQRCGSVGWMGMKGMFPVKAKDLILMSVVATLPASPSTIPETPDKPVMRLVCATTSTQHDKKPPNQGGYQRMDIDISGFVLEEDGEGGILLTQVTDLSGLGSWVPQKIISLVTQTMIPKSLARIGRRAQSHTFEGARAEVKGDDWLPPELGAWRDLPADEGAAADGEDGEEEEEEVDEEAEPSDDVVGGRTLSDLVAQLRTLTTRLATLEGQKGGSKSGGLLGRISRLFSSSSAAETPALSLLESGVVALLGGAASALTVFSLAARWADRR